MKHLKVLLDVICIKGYDIVIYVMQFDFYIDLTMGNMLNQIFFIDPYCRLHLEMKTTDVLLV